MSNPLEVGSKAHRAIGADMIIIPPDFNCELICQQFFAMFRPTGGFSKNFASIQGFSLTTSPNEATE